MAEARDPFICEETSLSDHSEAHILAILEAAAVAAGEAILAVRARGFAVAEKSDASPVTEADAAADAIIVAALRKAFPEIPIVAEESGLTGSAGGRIFFLVDPLDGTKEFVAGRDEFTVNIALIEDERPILGVVLAPPLQTLWAGGPSGAYRRVAGGAAEPIRARPQPQRLVAVASRSHRTAATDSFLAELSLDCVTAVGSSMKFCRIAEGAADIYPCLGRTMEWDTAAGQAVLEAAGGRVRKLDGKPLSYGKPACPDDVAFANTPFVAEGAPAPGNDFSR